MIDKDPPELGFKSINVSNRLIVIAMTAKSFDFLHLAIDCDSLAAYGNFLVPLLVYTGLVYQPLDTMSKIIYSVDLPRFV